MDVFVCLLPVFFPIVMGALIALIRFKNDRKRHIYVSIVTIVNTVFMALVMFAFRPEGTVQIVNMAGNLSISFHVDGVGCVFGSLISLLWPIAVVYSFEYMKHEGGENAFYTFYTMTYGITAGIAFAGNVMTMYLFYELLTFVTLPLVMHGMSKKSVFAGRRYVTYSVGGAAFAFVGMCVIYAFAGKNNVQFTYNGLFNSSLLQTDEKNMLLVAYLMMALGFGVKAALIPMHRWLPTASVAPTPVTALLHAVAVVKAGAFAILRITFYVFGPDLLRGTYAQYILMTFSIVTIIFGSAMALKEQHMKRRLAYSTVSNLSYLVFGISLMTTDGLTGTLTHMFAHGVIKITLFFCAGAILCKTGLEYVHDLRGLGKRMPITFFCFTVGSAAIVGIPPLPGFIGKWNLATAAVKEGSILAYCGVAALIISAILTALYMFLIVFKACFPSKEKFEEGKRKCEAGKCMTVPLVLLCVIMLVLGLFGGPLTDLLREIARGGVV